MHLSRTAFSTSVLSLGIWLSLTSAAFSQEQSIIINEIHYDPDVKTEQVEFIELYNRSVATISLEGWSFDKGIDYTFPAGATIPSHGYVVVTQNPTEFTAKFSKTAYGPWVGQLSNDGETIELLDATGKVADKVDYQLGFPWPTVGDPPGFSIELIHPDLDNDLAGSWRASVVGGYVAPPGTELVPRTTSWKYFKGLSEASSPDVSAWRQIDFDDASWLTGDSPFFYENGSGYSGATDLNDMNGSYSSVYLRKTFVVSDPNDYSQLQVDVESDDGCIVWINGVEVERLGMAGGQISFDGVSLDANGEPKVSSAIVPNPSSLLVAGNNVLAVHAFNQALSGSSDFLISATLIARQESSTGTGPTPGARNAVYATNSAPQIRQVDHSPNEPRSGETVLITAKATDPDGVASMVLEYQVNEPGGYIELTDIAYTNTWTSLPMNDAGMNGDETAGDDVYTAELPPSFQVNRRLIRYRITATDGKGLSVRVPYLDDPQPNFAYFVYDGIPAWQGSIQPGVAPVRTYPAEEMSRLPAYHLISKKSEVEAATWGIGTGRYAGDEYRWTGTLVYDGKVYDHIHFRPRGGVWRFSMVKNMWKFLMNRGHEFQARDNWGRKYPTTWRRVNLGASIQQGDFDHRGEQGMFESLGFRFFNLAGSEAPHTTFVTFRVIDEAEESFPNNQFEGDFWGVYLSIEQEDGRFLDAHNLPDGNLFKMENGTGPGNGALKNQGPQQVGNNSDLIAFNNGLSGASEQWLRDNLDLEKYYNYYTIVQAIHHYDICCGKNYYYYFNPVTGKMEIHSWDLDLTWADNMYEANDGGTDAIYDFGQPFAKPAIRLELSNRVREILDLLYNDDQAWRLIDEYAGLLQGPDATLSILAADRAMWDYNPKMNSGTYTPNLNKAGQGRYYQFPREAATNSEFRGSFDALVKLMKSYVTRRARLTAYPSGTSLATWEADALIPSSPLVSYTGPGGFPLNELSFQVSNYSGTGQFAAMKWRMGEVTPTNAAPYNPEEPNKYEIEAVWESEEITEANSRNILIPTEFVKAGSTYRVRCRFKDATGRWSHWSAPVEFMAGQPLSAALMVANLRLTELMYNSARGSDYDFIELHNASAQDDLDVGGAKFTQGIDYIFPPHTVIPAGGYLLVIRHTNQMDFRAFYGLDNGVPLTGPYSGNLANDGEIVTLRTSAGGVDLATFEYKDGRGWPLAADGSGHSLIPLILTDQSRGELNHGGNWRASTYLGGSPGQADPASPDTISLNEIAAHTDFPLPPPDDSNDWIELYNAGGSAFTFGEHWYLSDNGNPTNLTKWMIPPGTMMAAGGWVSFDERTGFHNPTNIGFGLNKAGEQVFLSYLPGTAEDRIVDAVAFKGQENDWSLGRYPDGGPWWYALDNRTRDQANAAAPMHVVISEIMYHPPDLAGGADNALDEFLEIFNPTPNPVDLYDTNGNWRLDGGVNFEFTGDRSLPSMKYLLVVNFDPSDSTQLDAFRDKYGITDLTMPILGPYSGKLNNGNEEVRLEKAQAPDVLGESISWVIVDEVIYADRDPWPQGADGFGPSLQRRSVLQHGSDPANWVAAAASAGRALVGGEPPSITTQPAPASLVSGAGASVTYDVIAAGTAPLSYQWLFNGGAIPGETGSSLTLDFVLPEDSGYYSVVVMNSAGSVVSSEVSLRVTTPPRILTHPDSYTVKPGESATFTVLATGSGLLSYMWQFNGKTIESATQSSLTLNNIQPEQEGTYTAIVMDENGLVVSQPAILKVLVPPTIILPPLSQAVVLGGDLTLSIVTEGTLPMGYRWRRGSFTLTNEYIDSHVSFFTIKNAQLADAGNYTVVVTNEALVSPGVLSRPNAVVTVLTDADQDGMPDTWETEYGFDPEDPSDADGDFDGDEMTNREEFQAGTDPKDPLSYLKIEEITADLEFTGTISVSFLAITNRTYSLEYRDSLRPGLWTRLRDIEAAPTNRMIEVVDQPSVGNPKRFYRLVTPRL